MDIYLLRWTWTHPYLPKRVTVVPPTGVARPGPYTSHTVRATWALWGRSGYFTGNFSHSFQLGKGKEEGGERAREVIGRRDRKGEREKERERGDREERQGGERVRKFTEQFTRMIIFCIYYREISLQCEIKTNQVKELITVALKLHPIPYIVHQPGQK